MSDVSMQLKSRGWYLTAAGIEAISTQPDAAGRDVTVLERIASKFDLAEIGAKWLQEALSRARNDGQLEGTYVLQVSKVKPPSANPRDFAEPHCKVMLTDGYWSCGATLTEVTNKLVTELVVGAKVQLYGVIHFENGTSSSSTTLQLSSANMRVLGGGLKRSAASVDSKLHRVANGEPHTKANAEGDVATNANSNTNVRQPRSTKQSTHSTGETENDNDTTIATRHADRPDQFQNDSSERRESERVKGEYPDRPNSKQGDYERSGPPRYNSDRPFRGARGQYRGAVRNYPQFPPRNAAPNGDRYGDRGRERYDRNVEHSNETPADRDTERVDRNERDVDQPDRERERERTDRPPPRSTVWDFLPQTLKDDANAKRNAMRHSGSNNAGHTQQQQPGSAAESPRSATPLSSGGQRDTTEADVDITAPHLRESGHGQGARGGWRRGGTAPRGTGPRRSTRDSQSSVTSGGPRPANDRRSFAAVGASQPPSASVGAGTSQDEQAKLPPRLTRQKQADSADNSATAATQNSSNAGASEELSSSTYSQHHTPYNYGTHGANSYHGNQSGGYHPRFPYQDDGHRGTSRGRGFARGAQRGYNSRGAPRYPNNSYYYGNSHAANAQSTGAASSSVSRTDTENTQTQSEETIVAAAPCDSPSQANNTASTAVSAKILNTEDSNVAKARTAVNATDDEKHVTSCTQLDTTEQRSMQSSNGSTVAQSSFPVVQASVNQPVPSAVSAAPQPASIGPAGLAIMSSGGLAQSTVTLNMAGPQQPVANISGMNMGVGVRSQPAVAPMLARPQFGIQLPPFYGGGGGIPFIPPGMLPNQRLFNPAAFYPPFFAAFPNQQINMLNMIQNQSSLHGLPINFGAQNPPASGTMNGSSIQATLANATLPQRSITPLPPQQQNVGVRAKHVPNSRGLGAPGQQEGLLGSAPNRAQIGVAPPQTASVAPVPGEAQAYQPQGAGPVQQQQQQVNTFGNQQNLHRPRQNLSVASTVNNANASPSQNSTLTSSHNASAQIVPDASASGNYAQVQAQTNKADVAPSTQRNPMQTVVAAASSVNSVSSVSAQAANAQLVRSDEAALETQITAVYQNYLAVYRLNQTVRARVPGKTDAPGSTASVSDEQSAGNGATRFVKATIRRIDTANKSVFVVLNEGELAGNEQWINLADLRPHYDKPPELSAYRSAEQQKAERLAPSLSTELATNASPAVSVPNTPATSLTGPFSPPFNGQNQPPFTTQNSTSSFTAASPSQVPFAQPSQAAFVSPNAAQYGVQPTLFVGQPPITADPNLVQQPPTPSYTNPISVNFNMNLGVTILGNQQLQLHPHSPLPNAGNVLLTGPPYGAAFMKNLPATIGAPVNVAAQLVAAQQGIGSMAPFGIPPDDNRPQMVSKFEPNRN